MDAATQLKQIFDLIAQLQLQVADAQAAIESVKKAAYDEGFSAGVASVPAQTEGKIYTQADLDAAVEKALIEYKSSLLVKFQEAQGQETAIETSFADLLK